METIRASIGIEQMQAKTDVEQLFAAVNLGSAAAVVGDPSNVAYRRLYNWFAVNTGKLAPSGYRVASNDDYTALVDHLSNEYDIPNTNTAGGAGNKLKSCRQVSSPLGGACATSTHPRWNSNATHYGANDFGFSNLPGGYRATNGSYSSQGAVSLLWVAGEFSGFDASMKRSWNTTGDLNSTADYKWYGFSVRCVRDAGINETGYTDGTIVEKVEDVDGNIYDGVKIGSQVWLAQNLAVTKLNDETPIDNIDVNADWAALYSAYSTSPAYCNYGNTTTNVFLT